MAEPAASAPDTFKVGAWRIDGNTLTASRDKVTRKLEPRAYRVLAYFVGRPGQLVTTDELLDVHWDAADVSPNAVPQVIAHLRRVLEDNAKKPHYIETVARSGYRFVGVASKPQPAPRAAPKWHIAAGLLLPVVAVLTWYAFPEKAREPTLAVLPFANLTGDVSFDYLGNGVAEELILALGQIPTIGVSARNRSFQFNGGSADMAQTASALDVSYLVDGWVRRNGQDIHITAQLIDPQSGLNIWALTQKHDMLQLSAIKDAISQGVGKALAEATGVVVQGIADGSKPSPDPAAYDLFLRGRHIWQRRGLEPLQPAIDYFHEVVTIDPDFARGWDALATAYLGYPYYSAAGYQTRDLAEGAAKKALELDPDMPDSHGVLATFAYARGEWQRSEALYLQGIRRDEQSAMAHFRYAEFLGNSGKIMQSLVQLRRTIALDSAHQEAQLSMAFAHLQFRDYAGAAERFSSLWQRGQQTDLCWMGYFISMVYLKEQAKVAAWIDAATSDDERKELLRRFVAAELGGSDDPDLATSLAVFFRDRPDSSLAIVLLNRLGAQQEALGLLNARFDAGAPLDFRPLWLPSAFADSQSDYVAFLERVGLIDYWESSGLGDVCVPRNQEIVCDAPTLIPDALRSILSSGT